LFQLLFVLTLCAVTTGLGSEGQAQELRPVDRATEAFLDRRYAEAARILEALYLSDPVPLHLYNIARAYEEAGDHERAFLYFSRFLETGPAAEEEQTARERLKRVALRRPAWLDLSVRPEGAVASMDGEHLCATPCRRKVPAGVHFLEVSLDGYRAHLLVLDLEPAGHHEYRVDLLRPLKVDGEAGATRSLRLLPWISAGAGAAAGTAGGFLLHEARNLRQAVSTVETNDAGEIIGMSQEEAFSVRARADRFATAGGVLLGVGGVAVATGVAWGLHDLLSSEPPGAPKVTVEPIPGGGLSFTGSMHF